MAPPPQEGLVDANEAIVCLKKDVERFAKIVHDDGIGGIRVIKFIKQVYNKLVIIESLLKRDEK